MSAFKVTLHFNKSWGTFSDSFMDSLMKISSGVSDNLQVHVRFFYTLTDLQRDSIINTDNTQKKQSPPTRPAGGDDGSRLWLVGRWHQRRLDRISFFFFWCTFVNVNKTDDYRRVGEIVICSSGQMSWQQTDRQTNKSWAYINPSIRSHTALISSSCSTSQCKYLRVWVCFCACVPKGAFVIELENKSVFGDVSFHTKTCRTQNIEHVYWTVSFIQMQFLFVFFGLFFFLF